MRLPPQWRTALLTLHIATAVSWLGADLVLFVLVAAGAGGRDPVTVYPAAALIGSILLAPLSVLVWLIGVLNATLTRWGLLTWWWVAVKLAGTTVMTILVVFLLTPRLLAAADAGALLPAAERVELLVPPIVSGTLLVLLTVLSTYKPWGRIRSPSVHRTAGVGSAPRGR